MPQRTTTEPCSPPALIAAAIAREAMAGAGARIGVAVSGGADSVCLLASLVQLAAEHRWDLVVLHLNHGLRGAEADADALFAASLASKFGLPCVAELQPVEPGPNWEGRARRARLDFFARQAKALALDCVATGHTQDDQAETVLMRLLRGASPESLAGIQPVTSSGLIRPMLDVTHQAACDWLRTKGIGWREDATNANTEYTRNWLRHDVLPLLETRYAAARATLARHAGAARWDATYWAAAAESAAAVFEERGGALIAALEPLAASPPALRRRVLRWALSRYSARMTDYAHVEAVDVLIGGARRSGRVRTGDVDAWRSMGFLRIGPPVMTPAVEPEQVTAPGDYAMPWRGSRLRITRFEIRQAVLRAWRPGDQAAWTGAPERMKRIFQRARVPAWDRAGWPVLESGGLIVWAGGLGSCPGIDAGETPRRHPGRGIASPI